MRRRVIVNLGLGKRRLARRSHYGIAGDREGSHEQPYSLVAWAEIEPLRPEISQSRHVCSGCKASESVGASRANAAWQTRISPASVVPVLPAPSLPGQKFPSNISLHRRLRFRMGRTVGALGGYPPSSDPPLRIILLMKFHCHYHRRLIDAEVVNQPGPWRDNARHVNICSTFARWAER